MSKHNLLAEKRTHLAEKRTELAYERTMMAYIRTAVTVILFGIAFFGLSKVKYDFFFYAGAASVTIGVILLLVTIARAIKHSREIQKIKDFFERLI